MIRYYVFSLVLFLCFAVRAESDASSLSPATDVGELPQKTVSRDPFWPIGYIPPKLMTPETQAAAQNDYATQAQEQARAKARAALKVGGIVKRNGQYFASINNQMVRTGDIITLPMNDYVFRFIVRNITMQKVQIEPVE